MADELVYPILASATIQARRAGTLIHITQTPGIIITAWALASEAVYHVNATTAVRAWITCAFVYVSLAMLPGKARFALAGIPKRQDTI